MLHRESRVDLNSDHDNKAQRITLIDVSEGCDSCESTIQGEKREVELSNW